MKNRKSWRDHPIMWVIGCIDANGAITANPSREGRTHSIEESKGKRWRWCVWSQEFIDAGPRMTHPELSDEESFTVCDWLVRRGYAAETIIPEKKEAS